MAKLLFITQQVPWPIEHGGSLRVINLAKQLSRYHDCHLLCFSNDDSPARNIAELGIFKKIRTIPPLKGNSLLRHFRISDDNFFELSSPIEFEKTCEHIQQYVNEERIEIALAMGIFVAEFVVKLKNVKKLLDDCDCRTLALERDFAVYKSSMSVFRKAKYLFDLFRVKGQEQRITQKFDLITTISPVDASRINQLNGNKGYAPVIILPNGVHDDLFDFRPLTGEIPNTICFWGNLAFPPNRTAIEYFCDEIFLPYLQPKGIQWFVIGKDPGQLMEERAHQYPDIILKGFVEDLFGLAGSIPIMVNPMVTGSGQKNKVLEAFMMARGVVSTSMGMESFPVTNKEYCVIADHPKEFSEAVIDLLNDSSRRIAIGEAARQLVKDNFTWERVGVQLNDAINRYILE